MAHILIIDDSPTETHILTSILEKNGFRVSAFPDAQNVVENVRTVTPDAVLMDVVMPGISGFQATRKLSKDPSTSAIPVILVTTKDQETDRIWGMRQGARDYIVKPVDEEELMTKIRAVLGG
jgi:twitching motility two-component system response regulator PilH